MVFSEQCCGRDEMTREEDGPLVPKLWPRLKLEGYGLRFGRSQLARLNLRLAALLHSDNLGAEDGTVERARAATEQATERLVQRLVCTVGELDPRFASKFLITLDSRSERAAETRWPGRRFRYLIRLDTLSWPPLYTSDEEDKGLDDEATSRVVDCDEAGALPAGWVRVRPTQGLSAQTWAEFLAPSGCLRRDRVVERFASLLSQAASAPPSSTETDESRVCGGPGKVLDAGLLQQMLAQVPPQHQLFYGPSEAQRCRPPDPRDFQLAVVHEGGCGPVLLRVGLLSPTLQAAFSQPLDQPPVIEVRLTLGIALGGWLREPTSFPARLPLHHPLALPAYQAAQHGYYAIAVESPTSLRCEERRSAWQASFPGAELELDGHFSSVSTPKRVLAVLRLLAQQMERPCDQPEDEQSGLRTVRDRVLRALVWRQLERWASLDAWEPASLAAHVLLCLDSLLATLRTRHAPHFFLPDANLLLSSEQVAQPGSPQDQEDAWEAAVSEDVLAVAACLSRLHSATRHADPEEALHAEWGGGEEERRSAALEAALLARWRSALNTVSPSPVPAAPRSLLSRLRGKGKQLAAPKPEHFSPRQLDYIAQVVRELVRVRRASLQHQARRGPVALLDSEVVGEEGPAEDFLFLLRAVLEQALGTAHTPSRRSKNRRQRRGKDLDRQQAWRDGVAEAVRRDPVPCATSSCSEEMAIVRHLLLWLWRATGSAPRALRSRLTRFLALTWSASREGAWHLTEWRRRHEDAAAELRALAAFCTMLLASQEGWTGVAVLRDAAEKGWRWARSAQAELARSGSLQLVLAPAPGVVRRCDVALALQPNSMSPRARSRTLPARHRASVSQAEVTLRLGRTVAHHEVSSCSHQRLRDASPLSAALDSRRRYGQQHAVGNLVHAFIAMHRISVLQEVAALLPPADRQPVLDALQRLSRVRRLTKPRMMQENEAQEQERYTAWHAEFPLLQQPPSLPPSESNSSEVSVQRVDSILGSCRAARTLQRRHSLFGAFPGELDTSLPLLHSASPASVRRRYGGAAGAMRRPGIAVLQLSDAGEITLRPEQEPRRPLGRRITKL